MTTVWIVQYHEDEIEGPHPEIVGVGATLEAAQRAAGKDIAARLADRARRIKQLREMGVRADAADSIHPKVDVSPLVWEQPYVKYASDNTAWVAVRKGQPGTDVSYMIWEEELVT